ncbi:hypothetical protein V1503_19365 [Bacillus sp. SCS-151]|uniref:hypothetical protein n=1 Tax=Nanhaiella sioensis TaxID=3115293 RepID=UPI00397D03B6
MKGNEGSKLLLSLSIMPFTLLIHGFVLSLLWEWFIVSAFSVPSISIIEAVGVMLVVDFILLKIDWKEEAMEVPMEEFIYKLVAHSIVMPFWGLGIGYILTLFI